MAYVDLPLIADSLQIQSFPGVVKALDPIGKSASICLEADCSVWKREGQGVTCECGAAQPYSVLAEKDCYRCFAHEKNETFTGAGPGAA